MTALAKAIEQLQSEVDDFNQGTLDQPKEGTYDWYRLRGLAIGLSALKRMQQLDLGGDNKGAERYFRVSSRAVKAAEATQEEESDANPS